MYGSNSREFYFFLLKHNCILSEMRLKKNGIETDANCRVCMKSEEGLLHLFLYCQKFEVLMRRTKNIVKSMFRDKYDRYNRKNMGFFFSIWFTW